MLISCHECCERLVLSFDGEDADKDPTQLTEHLRECGECRAFSQDLTRLRREFVSVPRPFLRSSARQVLLETVRAEAACETGLEVKPAWSWLSWVLHSPSVKWVGGLAVLILLLASWSLCFYLGGQVSDLKRKLDVAHQQAAAAQSQREHERLAAAPQAGLSESFYQPEEMAERGQRFASPRRMFF